MRTIARALLAFGFVGAIAIGAPMTSKAQGVFFSGAGVGVEITTRPYNQRHPRYNRYYDNQPYAYQYYRGPDYRYRTHTPCHPNGCNYRY
jgi:hypothetical protein